MQKPSLTRFAWLSIGAAIITILLKSTAYWLTGSVGLLSDALESTVNLAGGIIALVMLITAARPPDEEHEFGYSKAEYFSSGAEGGLIFIAAISIGVAAIRRLLHPMGIEQVGLGLVVSAVASLINFWVARTLMQAAKTHHSITLEADSRHLMTDVLTSVGVIIGVGAVALTGWQWLDPVIALLLAVNILWTGYHLVWRSALGLLDRALPAEEENKLVQILESYQQQGIQFHALRTRQAGALSFIAVHILVPGDWTVLKGHQLLENLEKDIRQALPGAGILTHLEPLNDPSTIADTPLTRDKP